MITLFSEGVLLVVAAQAGFLDGPRVLANMAVDYWVPRRFAALSDRLTTQNGIVLMGVASLAALLYTRGDVGQLVVMYSINVFLTFSLSHVRHGAHDAGARRRTAAHWQRQAAAVRRSGFLLCATILVITVIEKFREGGWLTLVVHRRGGRAVLRHPRPLPRVKLQPRAALPGRAHLGAPADAARPLAHHATRRCPPRACWCRATAAWASTPCSTSSAPSPATSRTWSSSRSGVIDSGGFKGAESRGGARGRAPRRC